METNHQKHDREEYDKTMERMKPEIKKKYSASHAIFIEEQVEELGKKVANAIDDEIWRMVT